jgi:hypothetical protein
VLHVSVVPHVPQEPPQPSLPQRCEPQFGVHASVAVSEGTSTRASVGASTVASLGRTSVGTIPPSTSGSGRTSGVTHVPSSPQVRICSSQNWLTVQFVEALAHCAGGSTRPAQDKGMKSRT